MKHENKNYAKVGFPFNNYTIYPIIDRNFYCIQTNTFKDIIEEDYLHALKQNSDSFGTGNAMDIIKELFKSKNHLSFDLERFSNFLKTEQFCYIVENANGEIRDNILRIDLFRKLEPGTKNSLEFVGGIFHSFKHFSIDNINLSTGNDINEIENPKDVIQLAIKAFFFADNFINGNFDSKIPIKRGI